MIGDKEYLSPGQVAYIFSVDPKTVTRWCKEGKIEHIRTPSGRYKVSAEAIRKLVGEEK